MTRTRSLYRMFKKADGAAPVASIVIAMIALACGLTAVGVVRVSRQHEVLRLGYQLAHGSEQVGKLREARRRLELERATLTAPERIRRLATQLGMTPVSPDHIRIIDSHARVKIARQP